MWDHINPEIVKAARTIADAGKYDDAIFAAFRLVESVIQDRISSKQIGEALLAEAFDGTPPRINISIDARDQRGIQSLFSGALTNIRNDRGHKKAPLTPCESLNDCILYLSFASFLFYLLTRDKNTFPRIDTVRVLGNAAEPRAELRGVNLSGQQVSVTASGALATIVRREPTLLEVVLEPGFFGNVSVVVDGKSSTEVFCDAASLGKEPNLFWEIIAAEIPLYSDSAASKRRQDVVGMLMRISDTSFDSMQIVPTYPNRYTAGYYITNGPHERSGVDETWYVDPDSRKIEYAWTGSLIMVPNVIGPAGDFKFGGISILPNSVHTQLGENRCLRVSAWGRDRSVQKEFDVTDRVKWTSVDPSIAFVKGGTLIPKRLGKARAECEFEGFVASIEISVEHLTRGQQTTYFQGIKGVPQIRFDMDDNLYLCNNAASVFRLDRAGGFDEVLRLSRNPRSGSGIDCLVIDGSKNLYINDNSKNAAFKFSWDGSKYVNPIEIVKSATGAKKGMAVTPAGDVFVAIMGPQLNQGWILRRDSSGNETSIQINGMPIWITSDLKGRVYVPVGLSSVMIFEVDGTLIETVSCNVKVKEQARDISVDRNGVIYLMLASGRIVRLESSSTGWRTDYLGPTFKSPSSIAVDSRGRIYVASAAGNSVEVIY